MSQPKAKTVIFSAWKDKEKMEGRTISAREIAAEIGVSRNTANAYLNDKVQRPDLEILAKFCSYFNVPPGPVPFLVWEPD